MLAFIVCMETFDRHALISCLSEGFLLELMLIHKVCNETFEIKVQIQKRSQFN